MALTVCDGGGQSDYFPENFKDSSRSRKAALDETHKQALIVLVLRALWVEAKRPFLVRSLMATLKLRTIILFSA